MAAPRRATAKYRQAPAWTQGMLHCPRPAVEFPPARREVRPTWRDPMPTGTVKFFNAAKGFGFIHPDDGSKDVFVHISAVERAGLGTLAEGQKVSFELARGKDGKTSADNLKSV